MDIITLIIMAKKLKLNSNQKFEMLIVLGILIFNKHWIQYKFYEFFVEKCIYHGH